MSGKWRIKILAAAIILCLVPSLSFGDVVTEWNEVLLDMIKTEGISNQLGNRTLAMMHIAMFDAINGIQGGYTPFLIKKHWPKAASADIAGATAAYQVLTGLYPEKAPQFTAVYQAQLGNTRDHLAVKIGVEAAEEVLKWRENDGSDQAASVPYPGGEGLGEWHDPLGRPALLPGWGQVKPFAMTKGDQFRLQGPPPLNSYEYARDYNEVKEIGRKEDSPRTVEQTTIAQFWRIGIPRMWNLVAHQVAESRENNLVENARLFALLNVAMADASIVGWDMKYHYGYWRPVTAIQSGALDDNDETQEEVSWNSLLMPPPFPEYVSGHSTTCAAAATVLANYLGSNEFTFELYSEANPGLPARTFNTFWEAAREAGISRIYGGIHFNFSNVEGFEAGRSLGRYISSNFMTPK